MGTIALKLPTSFCPICGTKTENAQFNVLTGNTSDDSECNVSMVIDCCVCGNLSWIKL